MLESENLYPAVASRPSQSLELRLIGVLRAAAAKGYPVKIALIANADDLEDTSLLGRPQAYAEYLGRELGGVSALNGPLVVIDPSGFGVSGRELRERALAVDPKCHGVGSTPRPRASLPTQTEMPSPERRSSSCGVRRPLPGRPLPANVPPATYVVAVPARSDGFGIVLPLVLGVSFFLLAWLGYELWASSRTRRTEQRRQSAEPPRPCGLEVLEDRLRGRRADAGHAQAHHLEQRIERAHAARGLHLDVRRACSRISRRSSIVAPRRARSRSRS